MQSTFSGSLEAIIDIEIDDTPIPLADETEFVWNYPIILLRHSAEVSAIKICTEFKIVVSIAEDKRAVIWDSEKIEYISTIEPSCNTLKCSITHLSISSTLGDILTVYQPKNNDHDDCFEFTEDNSDDFISISMSIAGKSQLRLHNINAKYIAHTFIQGSVVATCISLMKEGTGINMIATALADGSVRLYSTWNLSFVREIATNCLRINEISFSKNHYLILLSEQEIQVWGSDGISSEKPSFHDLVLE